MRVAMAVDVAPQRRHAVEVGVAVGVEQRAAVRALDEQHLLVLRPPLLLGERVPQDAAVGLGELAGVHGSER